MYRPIPNRAVEATFPEDGWSVTAREERGNRGTSSVDPNPPEGNADPIDDDTSEALILGQSVASTQPKHLIQAKA